MYQDWSAESLDATPPQGVRRAVTLEYLIISSTLRLSMELHESHAARDRC